MHDAERAALTKAASDEEKGRLAAEREVVALRTQLREKLTKVRLHWDPVKFEFTGFPEATAFLKRDYRAGWLERLGLGALTGPTGRMILRNLARRPWRAALSVIFPEARIEVALLYTAAPRLIVLDDATLDAAKPRFVTTEQSLGNDG